MKNETLIGILLIDEEKAVSEKIDGMLDFQKMYKGDKLYLKILFKFLEANDARLFLWAIKYIDNTYADKLDENYRIVARDMLMAILNDDVDTFSIKSAELLNMIVNIPGIDEVTEDVVIMGIITTIVKILNLKFSF